MNRQGLLIIFLGMISYFSSAQVISIDGIGDIKIGMDTTVAFQMLNEFDHQDFEGVHYFVKGRLVHLYAWTYENSTIRGIGTKNPLFKLESGIRVGSTIEDVLFLYPESEVGFDLETEDEYISITKYFEFEKRNRVVLLWIKGNDDSQLISDGQDGEYVLSSTNGYISGIEVYNWN